MPSLLLLFDFSLCWTLPSPSPVDDIPGLTPWIPQLRRLRSCSNRRRRPSDLVHHVPSLDLTLEIRPATWMMTTALRRDGAKRCASNLTVGAGGARQMPGSGLASTVQPRDGVTSMSTPASRQVHRRRSWGRRVGSKNDFTLVGLCNIMPTSTRYFARCLASSIMGITSVLFWGILTISRPLCIENSTA